MPLIPTASNNIQGNELRDSPVNRDNDYHTVIRWHRGGLPIVLALEIATPLRPTNGAVGNSPADPRDEPRQPVVGCAENPW
ncbi:hypothetical protein [Nitrobacter sp. TKz-YC02]|uniref:hypothetical protein n=1 Tax=Nitrobacter sp. TKz-YC02 TaxID=3398704 RepID=UPI003CF8F494